MTKLCGDGSAKSGAGFLAEHGSGEVIAWSVKHVISAWRRYFTAIMYPTTATAMPINAKIPNVSLNTKYPITAVVGGVR